MNSRRLIAMIAGASRRSLGLVCVVLVGAIASPAQKSANTITITANGSAKLLTVEGKPVIQLTPSAAGQAGSAFTSNSVSFNPNYTFSVFFQFLMTKTGGSGAADGMTFVLQTEGANALGASGGAEGYGTSSSTGTGPGGISPSVAVEFDTAQNPWDSNDNHVAVLTNGQMIDLDSQTPYGVSGCASAPPHTFGCLSNGDVWSVWVDYDGTDLNVAVADNSTTRPANLISYPIDVAGILGQSSAFVGFTAGTGSGFQAHFVFGIDGIPGL